MSCRLGVANIGFRHRQPRHSLFKEPPCHQQDWGSWDQAGSKSRSQASQRGSLSLEQIKIASHQTWENKQDQELRRKGKPKERFTSSPNRGLSAKGRNWDLKSEPGSRLIQKQENVYSPFVPTAKTCELLLLEKVKINLATGVLQTFCGRTRLLLRGLHHPPAHILEVKSWDGLNSEERGSPSLLARPPK